MVTALGCLLAGCGGPPRVLPHSLYYQDGPGEQSQVWRLETDGVTRTELTHEEAGVDDFSVSPADGSLAVVSHNRLYLVDGKSTNRRLIADRSLVDTQAEDYVFLGSLGDPVFSPDGRKLAYASDGLHLYDLASGADDLILTNLGNLLGETYVFARENYSPGPWSPDGTRLLILMSYYEGSTLAVMDLRAPQPFTRLWTDGPVCCLFSWAADGRSVLVANPYYTGQRPGLWTYDAQTGEELAPTIGSSHGGLADFVGWPHQLPSGEMVYFHVALERFDPELGIPLAMVRSNPDGSDRTQLRPEAFHIREALWAEDGSCAVVVTSGGEGITQVVLAHTDGSPVRVLLDGDDVRNLTWGP